MPFRITSHHLSVATFSIGIWLLGSLSILSALFGVLFLGLLISGQADGGIKLFVISLAMFLPAIALICIIRTITVPMKKMWKIMLCVLGLIISSPAIILYISSCGKDALLYLLPIIVLFLLAWLRLAFRDRC